MSDLKMELKKRNLPVSGPKPQLIERLKPFAQNNGSSNGQNSNQTTAEANGSVVTTTVTSGGRTISISSTDNPGSVLSEMEVAVSPSNHAGSEEDEGNLSPASVKPATNSSPPPPSPVPSAMDTSEPSPPSSPNVSIFSSKKSKKEKFFGVGIFFWKFLNSEFLVSKAAFSRAGH